MIYSKSILFLGVFLLVGFWFFAGPSVNQADALTCNAATSTSTLSWNDLNNWSCGRVPTSVDDVVLGLGDGTSDYSNYTADVTSTVNSITFPTNSATSTVTFGTNITLTVVGNVSIGAPESATALKSIAIGASSNHLDVGGSLTLVGGTGARISNLTISTGTLTVGSGISFSTTNGQLTTTGAATINVTGTIGSGGTASLNSTTTVNFSGTSQINNGY